MNVLMENQYMIKAGQRCVEDSGELHCGSAVPILMEQWCLLVTDDVGCQTMRLVSLCQQSCAIRSRIWLPEWGRGTGTSGWACSGLVSVPKEAMAASELLHA